MPVKHTTLQELLIQKQVMVPLPSGPAEKRVPSDAETPQCEKEAVLAILFKQGIDAFKSGSVCCAVTVFRVILEIDPLHEKARLNLAVALATAGDRQQAIRLLESVLAQDPENRIARENLDILQVQMT